MALGGEQREPGLEAAISRAPDDPAAYLVYADWLQQHGEPRGELIVVQRALAGAPRDAALLAREAALFAEHGERLLGPLALLADAKLVWYCGFVRVLDLRASLAEAGPASLAEAGPAPLAALLGHPSLQFVHRLAYVAGPETPLAPLAEHAPPTLRWLELSGDAERLRELAARLSRLPARLLSVEHLQIGARTYRGVAEWLADTTAAR